MATPWDPRLYRLRSGRVVVDAFRDSRGRPIFLEVMDTGSGSTRIVPGQGWDVSNRSRTYGTAISEVDLPEVLEFFMEVHQTHWKRASLNNGALIRFPNAFSWCEPQAGDRLASITRPNKVFTVKHVAGGRDGIGWNCVVLLDGVPETRDELMWIGQATRRRTLVNFFEEDAHPDSTTPGEDTQGDVGTAYSKVVRPTITYLLETQRPGSIGSKPFGQNVQLKPRFRERLRDPEAPQESIEIRGWWMDNVFRFLCLHPRSVVADHLARWFKRFVQTNIPSLKASGLPEVLYWSQDDAKMRRKSGDDAAARIVRYYFRTEELEVLRTANIRHIDFNFVVEVGSRARHSPLTGWDLVDPYTGLYDSSGNYLYGSLDIADSQGA